MDTIKGWTPEFTSSYFARRTKLLAVIDRFLAVEQLELTQEESRAAIDKVVTELTDIEELDEAVNDLMESAVMMEAILQVRRMKGRHHD